MSIIIHPVEQGTEAWYSLRAGLPTASNFSKIVTSKGEESKSRYGYALTLAGETYAGKPLDSWEGNQWTDRGKELEANAIARYEFLNDVPVEKVGFVTFSDMSCGCSPDGFVGKNGMIEVKCLKAENHISALLYYKKNGTAPTDYIQQTQGQMWIADREWCDLIFHHPDLPMLVIRQRPIINVIAGLASGIKALLSERDSIVSTLREDMKVGA